MTIIKFLARTIKTHWLFLLILAVGIFARTWEFGSMPAGLNPDEASIGVEAYYLYKFGVDRNGISFPVHLISWGSGQNALYAYLLIPFIALKGLASEAIRMPMMWSGILSLPLAYIAGRQLLGGKYALVVMFLMAISPWHIVNSRWAVESNILPFIFLAGFVFLLKAGCDLRLFTPALICFSLCLYAYGTAYVAIPVFLALSLPALIHLKKIKISWLIPGMLVFSLLSLPIVLFVIINTFNLDTIKIGLVTIPRLPVEARYQSLAAVFGSNPQNGMANNLAIMFKLLWQQEDDFLWNFVEPFGYFYKVTFPLIFIGFIYLMTSLKKSKETVYEHWLLFSWISTSLAIGIIHPVNLTRLNLIFTPLLFCLAICLLEFDKLNKYVTPIALFSVSVGFVFFTLAYHGESYQKPAAEAFNAGILPSIEYAGENHNSIICISEQTRFAYIYTLYVTKLKPSEYLDSLEWLLPEAHPLDPSRSPRVLGMFRFRMSDCVEDDGAVYVLKLKEEPPNFNINYKTKRFNKYQVFLPKIDP